jgi:hypothetical protein
MYRKRSLRPQASLLQFRRYFKSGISRLIECWGYLPIYVACIRGRGVLLSQPQSPPNVGYAVSPHMCWVRTLKAANTAFFFRYLYKPGWSNFLLPSFQMCSFMSIGWDYLWTAATNGPIVHPPDDIWVRSYGGMILTGENLRTLRETFPNATLPTTNPTWTDPVANPGPLGEKLANIHLSHGTAFQRCLLASSSGRSPSHWWWRQSPPKNNILFVTYKTWWDFWSHSGEYDDDCLLGYSAV